MSGSGRAHVGKKLALSVLVGLACLWLAARKVDASELRTALSHFDVSYLPALVAISLSIQVVRAWRWRVELSPLARLPLVLLWEVVAVAYMMINVLPFRLGEPVRPVLLSWKSGLPIAAIVGNWVFEKTLDTAAMVLFVHAALLLNDLPPWASRASFVSLGAFAGLSALVAGFWLRGERFFEATLGRVLPDRARETALRLLLAARDGLQILPQRRLVAGAFALTMLVWALPVLSSYILMLAFGFDVPFGAALVVFVAIGAGTALPNPPGMFGVFQVAAVIALGLFGVGRADALAYGILLNAVQFSTLVAQGLVALALLGLGLGDVTRAAFEHGEDVTLPARPS